jgi:hypothetical protein
MTLYSAFMCWLIFSEIFFLAIVLRSKKPLEQADQSQSGRSVGANVARSNASIVSAAPIKIVSYR